MRKKLAKLHKLIKKHLSEKINLGKKANFQKPVNLTIALSGLNKTYDETRRKKVPLKLISL